MGRIPNFVFSNLENMFAERLMRNLFLSDLKKATGIKAHTLENYEKRQSRPGRKNYNKLAKVLGLEEWS